MNLSEQKKAGLRIRQLRQQCGLTRKDFEEKTGISAHTLRNWEESPLPLKQNQLKLLSNIFKSFGMEVSPSFLSTGIFETVDSSPSPSLLQKNTTEEIDIRKEIDAVKKLNPHLMFFKIPDDSLHPLFDKEDIIAGSKIDTYSEFSRYKGQICLLMLEDATKIVRRVLDTQNNIINCSPLNFLNLAKPVPLENFKVISLAQPTRIWKLSMILLGT